MTEIIHDAQESIPLVLDIDDDCGPANRAKAALHKEVDVHYLFPSPHNFELSVNAIYKGTKHPAMVVMDIIGPGVFFEQVKLLDKLISRAGGAYPALVLHSRDPALMEENAEIIKQTTGFHDVLCYSKPQGLAPLIREHLGLEGEKRRPIVAFVDDDETIADRLNPQGIDVRCCHPNAFEACASQWFAKGEIPEIVVFDLFNYSIGVGHLLRFVLDALVGEHQAKRPRLIFISADRKLLEQQKHFATDLGYEVICIQKPHDLTETVRTFLGPERLLPVPVAQPYEPVPIGVVVTANHVLSAFDLYRHSSPGGDQAVFAEKKFRELVWEIFSDERVDLLRQCGAQVVLRGPVPTFAFAEASGPPLARGRAVFSLAEIDGLRKQCSDDAIVLFTNEAEYSDFNYVDGCVEIGNGNAHFALIARGKGVSFLLVDEKRATEQGFGLRDGVFIDEKSNTTIRTGDPITIDTSGLRLCLGWHDLKQPESNELLDAFIDYARAIVTRSDSSYGYEKLGLAPPIEFMARVNVEGDAVNNPEHVGLLATEFFFLDGQDILANAFLNPSTENLSGLKIFVDACMADYFPCPHNIKTMHIRIPDVKRELFWLGSDVRKKLEEKFGIIDGIAMARHPDGRKVYEAIVSALLDGDCLGRILAPEARLSFSAPHTESVGDIELVRKLVGRSKLYLGEIGDEEIPILISPFIESVAGCNNAQTLIEACAAINAQTMRDHFGRETGGCVPVNLGTADLMTDIFKTVYGKDITRNQHDAIRRYMQCWEGGNPFLCIDANKILWEHVRNLGALVENLKNESGFHIDFGICGTHAQLPENYQHFDAFGIRYVSVPYVPIFRTGLQGSYLMQRMSKSISAMIANDRPVEPLPLPLPLPHPHLVALGM